MKMYGGVAVWIHIFCTSALVYPRGKSSWVSLDRSLGGTQICSALRRREESYPWQGIKPGPSSPSLYQLYTSEISTTAKVLHSRFHISDILQAGRYAMSLSFWLSNQYPIRISFLPHSCYMPCPPHPSWLDHSNYTWRRVKVMKLLIMHCPDV
jgi:hypothetical protein